MGGDTARLFVALDLPEAVSGALARWAASLAAADTRLRAVRAESMHVTLCFLGQRPLEEIDAIGAALADVAPAPAFELTTGGLVGFPREDRPRVLAATIEDRSRGLDRLQSRLAIALVELGVYRPERRTFKAHVTLARVGGKGRVGRHEAGSSPARAGQRLLAPVPFQASSVTLLRSRISSTGSVYEPLRSVFLDAPA